MAASATSGSTERRDAQDDAHEANDDEGFITRSEDPKQQD